LKVDAIPISVIKAASEVQGRADRKVDTLINAWDVCVCGWKKKTGVKRIFNYEVRDALVCICFVLLNERIVLAPTFVLLAFIVYIFALILCVYIRVLQGVDKFLPDNHWRARCNVIGGVRKVPLSDMVQKWNGKAWRKQQKSLALMCTLVCRFSELGGMVLDLNAGTLTTGRACIRTSRPGWIWERDTGCLDAGWAYTAGYYKYLKSKNILCDIKQPSVYPYRKAEMKQHWLQAYRDQKVMPTFANPHADLKHTPAHNRPEYKSPIPFEGGAQLAHWCRVAGLEVKESTVLSGEMACFVRHGPGLRFATEIQGLG
jgi:hypothetical protein